jgi:hypothetical protein
MILIYLIIVLILPCAYENNCKCLCILVWCIQAHNLICSLTVYVTRELDILVFKYKHVGSGNNTFELYLGCAQFESQWGHWLYWVFMVFLSPSRWMPELYLTLFHHLWTLHTALKCRFICSASLALWLWFYASFVSKTVCERQGTLNF